MTLPSSPNPLSFSQIETEFGGAGVSRLGKYRRDDPSNDFENASPSGSDLNLPLDTGIPTSGEIKFSHFRGKKLNIIVDYYTENIKKQDVGNNEMSATYRMNNTNHFKVVGGFRDKPTASVSNHTLSATNDWQGGKRIIIHINKEIGGKRDNNVADVALRTGVWPSGTELQVDVGSSGRLQGAGGNGGRANRGNANNAQDGRNGTSALGVEYPATINNGGIIRCGYGGGGGGSGASNDPSDKSTTDYGRSGAGGGGGAGIPAGNGGAGGTGGFNGENNPPDGPIDGTAGSAGTKNNGGGGGDAGQTNGANGGDGGDGGDLQAEAQDGTKGSRADDRAYTDTPGERGLKGSDGKAIYFKNTNIQNNSTVTGNSIAGRRGGTATGSFN